MANRGQKPSKKLPKRCARDNWKARYTRYTANDTRAKNKARRIIKNALRSKDPRKIALAQASLSPTRVGSYGVSFYVSKLLKTKGL